MKYIFFVSKNFVVYFSKTNMAAKKMFSNGVSTFKGTHTHKNRFFFFFFHLVLSLQKTKIQKYQKAAELFRKNRILK